ncbi:MAG TPA: ATP-binding protein [Actinoplanes sp.]|nr:ATP-binding protein [Actinoplanes sp.]
MGVREQDRDRLLADLASALTTASTDLDRVVQCAARAGSELIGDGAAVRLVNDEGVFDRAAVYHPDPALAEKMRHLLPREGQRADEGFAAEVRAIGGVVVRNDLSETAMRAIAGPLWTHLRALEFGAVMMAPLIADGAYLGNLSMSRKGRDRPFTGADAQLAADVAARVALAVATARSVTRLRTERENYEQIVQTCFEGVWKVDDHGRTSFVNDRMAAILGVTGQRMLDEPADAWLAEPGAQPWWRLPGGQPHELRLRRGDGHQLWAQLSVSPLPAPGGAPAGTVPGWLAMVTDISDRVRNRELGERLAQMQRLDSIGQLAGGIAHDFNNLLSIISGAAELLLIELPPASSMATLARQITSGVDQGAALTRQLLTFGRGEPGDAETVDVLEVVAGLAPMLQRTLGEHIEVRFPAPDDHAKPCHVRIDKGQLHQVIINLATNARDAMDAGGRLSIDCEHVLVDHAELGDGDHAAGTGPVIDDKAWFVRLAVSDTGTGMDAATLRHAFEPFYTTKAAGRGTGLGLAGVYGIVRAAGGLVRPYSEPGHGTTIKIYLPAVEQASSERRHPVSDRTDTPTRPARILVVEDDPALAELIQRLLQPAGYTVTVTNTPRAALAFLATSIVDLVITDVVMPDLTGPELAVKVQEQRPGLPIMYTSGYTAGVLGERAHLAADAILVEKPFTRTSLLAAVTRALADRP